MTLTEEDILMIRSLIVEELTDWIVCENCHQYVHVCNEPSCCREKRV